MSQYTQRKARSSSPCDRPQDRFVSCVLWTVRAMRRWALPSVKMPRGKRRTVGSSKKCLHDGLPASNPKSKRCVQRAERRRIPFIHWCMFIVSKALPGIPRSFPREVEITPSRISNTSTHAPVIVLRPSPIYITSTSSRSKKKSSRR